jgi:hypothetical protein
VGARLVVGRTLIRYVDTPASQQWRHNGLLGLRIVCVELGSGAVHRGPVTTTNWVFDPTLARVPDVRLTTRALVAPTRAGEPVTLSCSLIVHGRYRPRPGARAGRRGR